MRCTVIIPTYNRAELLSLTLQSLLVQDLGTEDFEVMVIDDGSSDHTAEVVNQFVGKLYICYFYQADEGYRVAKARNVGIKAATSPVCILIDSGILLSSECLRAHCVLHESATEPLAVCGYVYGFNEDNEDAEIIRQEIDPHHVDETLERLQHAGKHLDLREEFYAKYGDKFNYLRPAELIAASALTAACAPQRTPARSPATSAGNSRESGCRRYETRCRPATSRHARALRRGKCRWWNPGP